MNDVHISHCELYVGLNVPTFFSAVERCITKSKEMFSMGLSSVISIRVYCLP